MSNYLLQAGLLTLLFIFPLTCTATDTSNLGGVIVTATRTALIADQEVAPVTIITSQQIQLSGAETLGGLLRQYAGMTVASNGGPGQPSSLFLRGANSNQVLVMINGIKINPADGSGAALQNIHLNDIERIEIVKGPRAALYGSDAIGGVINIITRQAGQGLHYGAYAGAGRYATYDAGGHFDVGSRSNAFGLSASNYHTDGFPAVAGTTFNSGNTDRTWNAYGRSRIGRFTLNLNHWQSTGNTQYTAFSSNPPYALAPFDEHFQNQVSGLDLTGNFTSGWSSNLKLSHMLDEIDQRQPDPFNPGQAADFVHTQRNVIDWQNNFVLDPEQMLIAGLYSEAQHADSLSYGLAYDAPDHINALYLEDDIAAGASRLVVAARDTRDQAFGSHLTWNADYGYRFGTATRLTAGAGTGFRAPSAEERYGFGGNPYLNPETSMNLELGLHHNFTASQVLTLSAFRDSLNNLIQFTVTPTHLNGENENIARARVRGLEAEYTLTRQTWSWHASVMIQQPENLVTDSLLLRRPERKFTTSVDWLNGHTRLGVHLIAAGRSEDLDFNTGAPVNDAGYILAGVTLRQAVNRDVTVSVSAENLLDTRYQTAAGYNSAGRSLFVRLVFDPN